MPLAQVSRDAVTCAEMVTFDRKAGHLKWFSDTEIMSLQALCVGRIRSIVETNQSSTYPDFKSGHSLLDLQNLAKPASTAPFITNWIAIERYDRPDDSDGVFDPRSGHMECAGGPS